MNMQNWLKEQMAASKRKALPILSFPCAQLVGVTVRELIADSDAQANGMYEIAKRCDTAASVSMMDLSVEAECFGAEILTYDEEVPAVTGAVVSSMADAEKLPTPKVGDCRTGLYIDAIKKAKALITDRPVFAGVIGPYSLACRLMDMSQAMIYCHTEPDMVHLTLRKCTDFLIEYIKAYKAAGANGIVLAEPAAGLLNPKLCQVFSSDYIKPIVEAVQDEEFIVIYHNCGNAIKRLVPQILSTDCAAYHFGNAVPMLKMLEQMPADVLTMGNVDPAGTLRNGNPEKVRNDTIAIMEACCSYPNFLISSGCDIPPATPWENLDAFFAAVEEFYTRQ